MRKLFLSVACLLPFLASKGQTFTATINQTIPDDGNTYIFDLTVVGLPAVIDTNFGLETVCLNMTHTYCSDMEVKLQAPDGTTTLLFSGVGGGDDDFLNTCLEGSGTSITAGSAPFTGTFQSQGVLGDVNNGQNPNGVWHLLCRDMAGADIGFLTTWSLTFGSNPAHPFFFISSNLPIIKLTTISTPIGDDPKVPVTMEIIDNGAGMMNFANQTNYAFTGTIMTEWQGFTGPFYPKKNFDFELVDSVGNPRNASVLGLPSEHDWILKAEYLDQSLIKNMLTYEMSNRMGFYAPRTRMCEVILDGSYIGYYTFTEKIKRDDNRVNIASMTPLDVSGSALTGGYIIEMNINGDPGSWNSVYPPINNATCGLPVEFKYVYPRANVILPVQANYIHAYVDTFENVMNGPSFADPVNGYRKYINEHTFVDFLIVNEFSVNYDSYGRSTFMYKEKNTDGGKLKIGPPWDYDRAMDYNDMNNANGWVWQITHPGWPFPFWWSKMWTDPVFRKQVACRWKSLRVDVLSNDSILAFIDDRAAIIDQAQTRNFTVWNNLGGSTYADHINSLKNFMVARLAWIDNALAAENVALPAVYIPADTVVCEGTLFDAAFNGNQYSYNWMPGPDTSFVTLLSSGMYNIQIKDQYGCYVMKHMDVTISQPDANFTSVQVGGNPLAWSFTANNQIANSYAWDFGDGGNSVLTNPTHTYTLVGDYTVSLTIVDSINCQETGLDTISTLVGVADPLFSNGKLFPNPFDNEINIEFSFPIAGTGKVKIENALGQVVYDKTIAQGAESATLSTSHLPKGIYLLSITDGDKVQAFRIVKR
jgi:subtilisin-like proprotein convertase family protein